MTSKFNDYNEMHMDDFKNLDKYLLFLPIGISEGHGKHLPVGTDTYQADYITEKVAERIGKKAIVAPILNYGHCHATKNLPGTLTISFDSLRAIVYDILISASDQGFKNIVIISGHAGRTHMTALRLACEKILGERDLKIMLLSDYDLAYELKGEEVPETDGHGGQIETSRILDIKGELVKEERPSTKVDYPRFEVIKDYSEYLTRGMRGDAKSASKKEGKKINEYVIDGIVENIQKIFNL